MLGVFGELEGLSGLVRREGVGVTWVFTIGDVEHLAQQQRILFMDLGVVQLLHQGTLLVILGQIAGQTRLGFGMLDYRLCTLMVCSLSKCFRCSFWCNLPVMVLLKLTISLSINKYNFMRPNVRNKNPYITYYTTGTY